MLDPVKFKLRCFIYRCKLWNSLSGCQRRQPLRIVLRKLFRNCFLSFFIVNFILHVDFIGTFRENQMHAKVYIVIPIEKQMLSTLRNRFPFLDRTSQRQDMEKNSGPISILIPYYFCASLLANKGCKFSFLSAG